MYRKLFIAGSLASLLTAPAAASGAGTTLIQTIMTELRYDTNASIVPESQQGGEDFTLLLAPGFQAVNQQDKLELTGEYRPTGYFYFQNPDLNTISHAASLTADYDLSAQSSVTVGDRFTYTKESLETTLTGLQNERGAILTNSVFLAYNTHLTQRTSMSLSASDFILEFNDPIAVDSRNDSASVGLNFQATPETQLNGSYNFSYVNYGLPGGASSNQSTHSLNAGFSTRFRETTTLQLSAGAVYADAAGAGNGFFDWLAAAELRKTWPMYSANVSYTRQTTSSSGVTDQLTLNDSISTGISHDINRNVNIGVSGTFTRNHSKPDNSLDTKSFTASAAANWRMRDWLSFGAGFSHFKQESDGPLGEDVKRDHIFINVYATTYERRL